MSERTLAIVAVLLCGALLTACAPSNSPGGSGGGAGVGSGGTGQAGGAGGGRGGEGGAGGGGGGGGTGAGGTGTGAGGAGGAGAGGAGGAGAGGAGGAGAGGAGGSGGTAAAPSSHFSTTALGFRVPAAAEVPETQGAQIYAVGESYYSLFDVNGDGRPDLVFTSVRQGNGTITGTTPGAGTGSPHWNVHLNTGAGFSTTASSWPVPSERYHPASGSTGSTYWSTLDLDGDGKVDLLETSDPDVGGAPQPWGAVTPGPHWKAYPAEP